MAITVQCACGKALKAKDEHAGRNVRCPACGATTRLVAAPADVEGREALELALLDLHRLHGAAATARARRGLSFARLAAGTGLGCLGASLTWCLVGMCLALLGFGGQAPSDPPVPGLVGMAVGSGALVAIVAAWLVGNKVRWARAERTAAETAQAAALDVERRFPAWVKRMGGPTALHSEGGVGDLLRLLREQQAPTPRQTEPAMAWDSAVPTNATLPIPIVFRRWSTVPKRADEKMDKWDISGQQAYIADVRGALVLSGFYPLSEWAALFTLGLADTIFLRHYFLHGREETIRPDDIRRVVIHRELLGHHSYHLVVDHGSAAGKMHLFLAANKANDAHIIKLFKSLLPPEKVSLE